MIWRQLMLAFHLWKLNSKLPENLGMPPLLQKPLLRSPLSRHGRAKKAEKALADANKEHIQRDQAVTERLNKMSALAGGKYHALPLFVELQNSYTC
jgi:hypothetical protein